MTNKDKAILQKIIAYIDDVAEYAKGLEFDSFLQDKKTMTACAFSVSQIGELAKELTEEAQGADKTPAPVGAPSLRKRALVWHTVSKSPLLKEGGTRFLRDGCLCGHVFCP